MSADLTVVIAACAGAAIGLLSEWVGRIANRRQDERTYLRSRSDWESQQRIAQNMEQERTLQEREKAAAELIISNLQEHSVGPARHPDTSDTNRVQAIVSTIGTQRMYIRDNELRRKLGMGSGMLDYFSDYTPHGLTVPALIWVVRMNVLMWIGAWLRKEALPPSTRDWEKLERLLVKEFPGMWDRLRNRGVVLEDYRLSPDIF